MRILANAGGNLPEELLRAYRIDSAPMRIAVDGVAHDASELVGYGQVEKWIREARTYPQPHGGNAAEIVELLRTMSVDDPDLIVVTASRHMVGSYTAATSAARVLAARPRTSVKIEVIDSGSTELGIGMTALIAAQASRAGLSPGEVAHVARHFAKDSIFAIVPDTLDYLVKAGRATLVKAWLADALSLRPLLAVVDGELKVVDKLHGSQDGIVNGLVAYATRTVGRGRAVWIGVQHAAAPDRAAQLEVRVRQELDVKYAIVRPFHSAVYLGVGPGAVGLFVAPVDKLPWTPASQPPR